MKDYEKLKEAFELIEKAHGCLLEAAVLAGEREIRGYSWEFFYSLIDGSMTEYDCFILDKLSLEVLTLKCKLDEKIRNWQK